MGSVLSSLQSIPLRLLPCLDRSGAAEVECREFLYPYHSAYGYLFVSLQIIPVMTLNCNLNLALTRTIVLVALVMQRSDNSLFVGTNCWSGRSDAGADVAQDRHCAAIW